MTPSTPECSRAGCRAAASWNINWRNPRIHPEDRLKVWLACNDHREFLYDYLHSRGFPVRTEHRGAASPTAAPTSEPDEHQ